MSKATFTFGRFNAPTEGGHGKLISTVQGHAEKTGGRHYIFPSHSQDAKKNPLTHDEKVGFMRRLFPTANIVSSSKVRTAIDAMKHLESKGHTHVTMIVGSDRVNEFDSLLNKYRKKEFPKVKKVNIVSAGARDPDAEGAEGESASKHRALVAAGRRDEFIDKYSDKKLGAEIHNALKKGMQMESTNPIGIFLLGGPGSGKDYVLKNIFSHFDLSEVQLDQVLNGKTTELIESNQNIVINGAADAEKIALVKNILEGYTFDIVCVSVSNKISRIRNEEREDPLPENKRLEKWYRAEKLIEELDCFVFKNSINLRESNELEQIMFGSQIENLLERLVSHGLVLSEKKFAPVMKDKETGLPKKYVSGLSKSTALARKAHWKKTSKLSDSDPRAYEPAPGDATAKTKPSKHTVAVRKMMDEAEVLPKKLHHIPRSGNITAIMAKRKETGRVAEEVIDEGAADKSLSAKAAKSGVSLSTLKKVYRRGVAAWNSGHRPGTTPQQWGHARVNSYINKGKTYHTADKDLREEIDINELFEMQLVGADEHKKYAIAMTPGQGELVDVFSAKNLDKKPMAVDRQTVDKKSEKSIESQYKEHSECGTPNCCGECEPTNESNGKTTETNFQSVVDTTPTLNTTSKKKKSQIVPPRSRDAALDGLPVVTSGAYVKETAKPLKSFMPTPRQIPAPPEGHLVPPGYERVKSWGGAYELRKIKQKPTTVKEAIEYHIENQISFTDNVFRPGSELFFEMISEAKKLYQEGKYTPADEFELDMLNSDIGKIAEYDGQTVVLDYPIEEGLEECWKEYVQRGMKKKEDTMVPNCVLINEAEDPTDGKGIGKPFRSNGGGSQD
jgi:dephospho-CoA kinase